MARVHPFGGNLRGPACTGGKVAAGIDKLCQYSHSPSMTTTMNISLPEPLKEHVREQVATGSYANPSDYVRALIRADRQRVEEARLECLLLEGLASGAPVEVTPERLAELRTKARATS